MTSNAGAFSRLTLSDGSVLLVSQEDVEAAAVPTGSVQMFAASAAPDGWLLCDGSSVAIAKYPNLFAVIGTTYGGAGANFTLPDMRGRAPIGVGTGAGLSARALAASGGEETHLLTTPEMPSHTHTQNAHNHTSVDTLVVVNTGSNNAGLSIATGGTAKQLTSNNTTATNQNTGGGGAHNNMQPYLALNFIIKT